MRSCSSGFWQHLPITEVESLISHFRDSITSPQHDALKTIINTKYHEIVCLPAISSSSYLILAIYPYLFLYIYITCRHGMSETSFNIHPDDILWGYSIISDVFSLESTPVWNIGCGITTFWCAVLSEDLYYENSMRTGSCKGRSTSFIYIFKNAFTFLSYHSDFFFWKIEKMNEKRYNYVYFLSSANEFEREKNQIPSRLYNWINSMLTNFSYHLSSFPLFFLLFFL